MYSLFSKTQVSERNGWELSPLKQIIDFLFGRAWQNQESGETGMGNIKGETMYLEDHG